MNNRGAGLVDLLIAVALMGIVAAGFSKFMSDNMKAQRHTELSADRVAVQKAITSSIDCQKSLATINTSDPLSCKTPIALYRTNGAVLVHDGSTGKTVLGPWTVRASCIPVGSPNAGINIQVARPTDGTVSLTDTTPSHFNKDQFNNGVLSWSHPKTNLYPGGAGPCQNYFSAGTSCPGGYLLNIGTDGRRLCRYYGNLIHGSVSGTEGGPSSWDPLASPSNNTSVHHYGNIVTCPSPNWVAVTGGGSCDYASAACNNSGGFITTSMASYNSSYAPNLWGWQFECAVFYKPGCNLETIPGGLFVDCLEK